MNSVSLCSGSAHRSIVFVVLCRARYEVRGHLLFVYSADEATVGTYHCVMITKDNRLVTGDAKLGLFCCLLIVGGEGVGPPIVRLSSLTTLSTIPAVHDRITRRSRTSSEVSSQRSRSKCQHVADHVCSSLRYCSLIVMNIYFYSCIINCFVTQ